MFEILIRIETLCLNIQPLALLGCGLLVIILGLPLWLAGSYFLRRLALPKKVKDWSLRTLKEKLIKIGAKVVRHSRYVIFQMAEVAVPRALFCEILYRIRHLTLMAIPSGAG